jgi:hypothetical protein
MIAVALILLTGFFHLPEERDKSSKVTENGPEQFSVV